MAASVHEIVADLQAETEVLEGMLAGLPADVWEVPTPAIGWAVRDQISHLAYFDEMSVLAMTDADRFRREADAQIAGGMDFPDRLAAQFRDMPVAELHAWFRTARRSLIRESSAREAAERVPWYGPAMSLASCVTARLMETWAHGQDVADALGVHREPSARLRHVAHLGVRALPYSYQVRRLEVPQTPIRVELTGPDAALWTWGPEDAVDRVAGNALEFCLVVAQRRHHHDTNLKITGPVAAEWMEIAQAFAGAAGPGRRPASHELPAPAARASASAGLVAAGEA
ncbi:MAG: TIGR03084 family metal-binding protein [Sporichthyaceae bacterium]